MSEVPPSQEAGTNVWTAETNVPHTVKIPDEELREQAENLGGDKPVEMSELLVEMTEDKVRERMRTALAIIDEHFTIDRSGPKPMLACKLCGERITWVSKHLAVKHADQFPDLEVWRLPKALAALEIW